MEQQETTGSWLTATQVVNTLLTYACSEIGVAIPGSGSDIEFDLGFLHEELDRQSKTVPTADIQLQLEKIEALQKKAALWYRSLDDAIARAELGQAPAVLVPKDFRTPLDHEEFHDWRFSTLSVFEWAKKSAGITVPEWAGCEGGEESSSLTPQWKDIEFAQHILADLVRLFMVNADSMWEPGQHPDQRRHQAYLKAGKINIRQLSTAILPPNPANASAKEDPRTARDNIADVLPLVEGQGTPKHRTVQALPGYYRTIYWMALAIDRKLQSTQSGGPNTATNSTWPPERVLATNRPHKLMTATQLREGLILAEKHRIN